MKDLHIIIGRKERVSFPELGIDEIVAKVDTGAKTSSLHAVDISTKKNRYGSKVYFTTNYEIKSRKKNVKCSCKLIDQREIKNSGAQKEKRYIIYTPMKLGLHEWMVELSLTDRRDMKYDVLLGRSGLPDGILINPKHIFLQKAPI